MKFETKIKILVIRLSSLGDVLLTTPVVRALAKKHPNSEIHFLVKPAYLDAVKYNKYISKIISYNPKEVEELKTELKSGRCEFVVDLQNNFRSRYITRFSRTKTYRYSKPTIKKFLLVKFKINRLNDKKSIPQRYVESVPDLQLDSAGLDLIFPDDIKSNLPEGNYIGFCPGSKHFTKRWPPEYFIELGNVLTKQGYKIILFGGKEDAAVCSEIHAKIAGAVNLQNDNDLYQISADMKKCKLIVTNDSGLMHTASASGVPLISIFGSSVQEFGFAPYKIKNLILENNSLSCRPCSHIGRSECPQNHFKCMIDITPSFVNDNIQKFMAEI